MPTPIDGVGVDLAAAFGGTNLLFYAGAVGASAALAFSGADESIHNVVVNHIGSNGYGDVADVTGYILPAVVAPAVWLTGLAFGDREATGAGSAAVQALVFTVVTVSVLKIGVGREYPPADAHTFTPFQSWTPPFPAWPSGHSSSTTSIVAALTGYYGSDKLWIPLVGYPIGFAIDFGMLLGDQHWTSDLIAGAVIGQCIGWSVGRAFRARAHGEAPPKVSLVPLTGPSLHGVAVAGAW
jgi:membrane-associated phospholipid phosphatase